MKQYQSGVLPPQHTNVLMLDDDGRFPNNEHLPVIIYEHSFQISNEDEGADQIERIIQDNGWHHPWRNGIYDYHHFHSTAHEVLICYAGSARVQLGGPEGSEVSFKQGDVMVLPAGTAHKCLEGTADFKCIGAYPVDQMFDMCYGELEERSKNIENILKVPLPAADPIYGQDGPLMFHWDIPIAKRA